MRLPVRVRLLGIFLLISVIPLAVLGRSPTTAPRRLSAPTGTSRRARRGAGALILFIVAVGILAAIGLALFAANSVADPLRRIEESMAAVGQGDLDTGCPVVANDEIGAVAEGFNRMLGGLRERERIRETFGRYVTREIRDEILAGRASFEGRLEEVTILFADLRDFTPWVERTEPRTVVRDLNEYFTEMEAAIRAHGGLVLQYIGDEIEAVFGAPAARGRPRRPRAGRRARDAGPPPPSQRAARGGAASRRSGTASASTRARCSRAASAARSGSPTPWSATRSTSPRASRGSTRSSARRSW